MFNDISESTKATLRACIMISIRGALDVVFFFLGGGGGGVYTFFGVMQAVQERQEELVWSKESAEERYRETKTAREKEQKMNRKKDM